MALSGSFKTSGWTSSSGDVVSLLFEWTAKQSIENNTSTISWTLKCHRTDTSSYVMAGGFWAYINDECVYWSRTDDRIKLYKGTVIASGSHTITHNNDGTCTFTVDVEGAVYSYSQNCFGKNTFALDTIPRPSTVTFPSSYIGSKPTIVINSSSPKFTHTLLYSPDYILGSTSAHWFTIVENTSETTITDWTIPNVF